MQYPDIHQVQTPPNTGGELETGAPSFFGGGLELPAPTGDTTGPIAGEDRGQDVEDSESEK